MAVARVLDFVKRFFLSSGLCGLVLPFIDPVEVVGRPVPPPEDNQVLIPRAYEHATL